MGGGLSSVGAALGSGLSVIGLAGVAQSLGLAPATFLGLTVASWAFVASAVIALGVGYFVASKKLEAINLERAKGGLLAVTWAEIIAEARDFEKQAMMSILANLMVEFQEDIVLDRPSETVVIMNMTYKIGDLKYVIEKGGREYIALRSNIPFRKIVLFVVKQEQVI